MPTCLIKFLSTNDREFITVLFIFVVLVWCEEIGKRRIPEGSIDLQGWNKMSREINIK